MTPREKAREIGFTALLAGLALLILGGCASGPRRSSFQTSEVRGATKVLNRLGSEAKPHVEGICSPMPPGAAALCRTLRALYKGVLGMADGIDEALNKADAENTQDVDLGKALEIGFKVLDLVTEEEAVTRTVMRKETP